MNTVCGRITNVAPVPQANQSLVTTDQILEDDDQYENGRLRLGPPPARQFNALRNTSGANATVRVQNDAAGAPPVNQPFDLHDDDDDGVLPRLPDLGWMQDNDNPAQNLYVWAYIRPRVSGINQQVAFALNVNTEQNDPILQQLSAGRYAAVRNNNQVVHEIGHQFACPHEVAPHDIMGGQWLLTDATTTVRFTDPCLNLIRSVERPGS